MGGEILGHRAGVADRPQIGAKLLCMRFGWSAELKPIEALRADRDRFDAFRHGNQISVVAARALPRELGLAGRRIDTQLNRLAPDDLSPWIDDRPNWQR